MHSLLSRYFLAALRETPGDGGGGGAPAGAGDGAGSPPAETYFPEGLPDHFKGANDRETIDKIAAGWKDYRTRDAAKDLPDTPEGYLSFEGIDDKAFKLDDRFKAHFDSFGTDPGMKAAAAIAQKHGIPRPAFLEAVQGSLSALQEAGVLEPMMDAEAERAALLPEAAKNLSKDQQDAAIDRRMTDNLAFVDLMVQNRALPKEAGEYAQLMLADSAKGHMFLEWMRNAVQGGGNGPGAHGEGGGGSISHAQLKERQADPRNNPNDMKFDQSFATETSRLYRTFVEAGGTFER